MTEKIYSMIYYLGFGVLILLAVTCRKNPVAPQDAETLIRNYVDSGAIPSIAACIIKNDQIVWQYAYGSANREEGRSASEETVYLLASISKTVTGAAVMQLVERGLIDLDADISDYLPFQVRHPQYPDMVITTRMVLSHRSGLGWPASPESSFYVTYFNDSAPPLFPWIKEFMLPDGSDYNPSIWRPTAPGEHYWYSNFGGAFLGYLVEEVSGENFKDYCKNHIFQLLDMPNTSFKLSDIDDNLLAMPYEGNENPFGHFTYIYYPSACLRSSICDLSHFIIAMMNGGIYNGSRILLESTVEAMLTRYYPDNEVGLIWKMPGGGWYEHSGTMVGTSAQSEFHKDDKVGILVLSNGESDMVKRGGMIYEFIKEKAQTY